MTLSSDSLLPDFVDNNATFTNSTAMEGQSDEADRIVRRLKKNVKLAYTKKAKSVERVRRNFQYYATKQISDEDIEILTDRGSPIVQFNRTNKVINSVTGTEVQSRQEATYEPITLQSQGLSDLSNQSAEWVRGQGNYEDEESQAFKDSVICGTGFTEEYMDYYEDPDGMVKKDRVSPFEMGIDPNSVKPNFEDARFMFRVKQYTPDEFEAMWPGVEVGNISYSWHDPLQETATIQTRDYAPVTMEDDDDGVSRPSVYEVIKYQEWQLEDYIRILDPKGQGVTSLSMEEWNKDKEQVKMYMAMHGLSKIKQKRKVYKQYLVCGDTLLDQPDEDEDDQYAAPIDGFSFAAITGMWDEVKKEFFGLMSLMQDPQDWANKWLMQIQYILSVSSKGGKLVYESGTFASPETVKEDWGQAGTTLEVNPGKMESYKVEPAGQYPDGIDKLLQYALQAIEDVTGINAEYLGSSGQQQAGVLEDTRKMAAVTILADFFNSKRRYSKRGGIATMKFIVKYVSDGRLIKIDGDNGNKQFIPLLRDNVNFKYNISVDEAPTSPNMKEKVMGTFLQLLPQLLQANVPIPPDIIKYTNLPGQFVTKWLQYIDQSNNDPTKKEAQQISASTAQEQLKGLQLDNQRKDYELNNTLPSKVMVDRSVVDLNASKSQQQGDSSLSSDLIQREIALIDQGTTKIKSYAEITAANAKTRQTMIASANDHKNNIAGIINDHMNNEAKLTQQTQKQNVQSNN